MALSLSTGVAEMTSTIKRRVLFLTLLRALEEIRDITWLEALVPCSSLTEGQKTKQILITK